MNASWRYITRRLNQLLAKPVHAVYVGTLHRLKVIDMVVVSVVTLNVKLICGWVWVDPGAQVTVMQRSEQLSDQWPATPCAVTSHLRWHNSDRDNLVQKTTTSQCIIKVTWALNIFEQSNKHWEQKPAEDAICLLLPTQTSLEENFNGYADLWPGSHMYLSFILLWYLYSGVCGPAESKS